jgi:hypothetical protein
LYERINVLWSIQADNNQEAVMATIVENKKNALLIAKELQILFQRNKELTSLYT